MRQLLCFLPAIARLFGLLETYGSMGSAQLLQPGFGRRSGHCYKYVGGHRVPKEIYGLIFHSLWREIYLVGILFLGKRFCLATFQHGRN